MKLIEQILIEGVFRVRKIFTSRTSISNDMCEMVSSSNEKEYSSKVQPMPRGMDFLSSVNKINQVLSYDTVIGMCKQSSIDDSMMITGVKMSGLTKSSMNPNDTVSSGVGLK